MGLTDNSKIYSNKHVQVFVSSLILLLIVTATAQETSQPPDEEYGKIQFSDIQHDFGDVLDIDTYTTTFPFSNSGSGSLIIEQVKASCGCTTPALEKKVFLPGESSEITVSFKPKGTGFQAKKITVYCNDPAAPVTTLTIKADVTQFVTASPRLVRFPNARKGTGQEEIVTLTALDPGFEVQRLYFTGTGARYFTVEQLPRSEEESEGPIQLKVSLSPETAWGSHFASLNIQVQGRPTTDSDEVTHIAKITINTKVSGNLKANATMFQVSVVRPGEPFTKIVSLTRVDGQPFNVLSIDVVDSTVDGMTAKAVPLASSNASSYSLVLTGTPQRNEQSIRGQVRIYTDVPGEEELTLRIGGIARIPTATPTPGPKRPEP